MSFEKAEIKGQNQSILQLCRKGMPGHCFSQKVFIQFKKPCKMFHFNKTPQFLSKVSSIGYAIPPGLDRALYHLAPPSHRESLLVTALSLLCLQDGFVPSPFLKRRIASWEGIWLLIPWLSPVSPSNWAHPMQNHLIAMGRNTGDKTLGREEKEWEYGLCISVCSGEVS